MNSMINLARYKEIIETTNTIRPLGKVIQIIGLIIEADGPKGSIGDLCYIYADKDDFVVSAEIVGFKEDRILLMPLGTMDGLRPGANVINTGSSMKIQVGPQLLGRVLDGLGRPIDNLGEINSQYLYSTQAEAINPLKRSLIREPLSLGIRSVDGFNTIGKGQRVGIFAGSGVREVREFIESTLGADGMKRSIVVAATSEQPSLVKIKAAFVAMAIAEYFRDEGKDVLFMLDSVTRIAMAQREVGLAVGEPPATRGYTPSVFALMPKLLERAGSNEKGTITGLYTVLVEGDDFNEPISDTARSILDGHIMLSRELAHKNHYPAVDVLQSVSRVMNDVVTKEHKIAAGKIRNLLAVYRKNEDLINIGAYVKGTDPATDKAIALMESINFFLCQSVDEHMDYENTVNALLKLAEHA